MHHLIEASGHFLKQDFGYFPIVRDEVHKHGPNDLYTYANMMSAVAGLERAGLIEDLRTAPSPSARYRSRMRARPLLLFRVKNFRVEFFTDLREVLLLRDARRSLVFYSDSDYICGMRRDVLEHNEFLAGIDTRLDHPDAHYDALGFLRVGGR